MDNGYGRASGGRDRPTAAQEIDLLIWVNPPAKLERQREVQERGRRTRVNGPAVFLEGFIPGIVGAEARGSAGGCVLAGDLAIQKFLSRRIILDVFIGQQSD